MNGSTCAGRIGSVSLLSSRWVGSPPGIHRATSFVFVALLALICLGSRVSAATVTRIHSFGEAATAPKNPQSRVIEGADGKLYGTAAQGGTTSDGAVFRLNKDGTGYEVLRSFVGPTEGAFLYAGLIQATDGRLYGTAFNGGTDLSGTVFGMDTDGANFAVLHHFDLVNDGGSVYAGVTEGPDGFLYGTTQAGGSVGTGSGTIFKVAKNGTGFSVLYTLTAATDGGLSVGDLVIAQVGMETFLYGTAFNGGSNGAGTIFSYGLDVSGFSVLKNLISATDGASPQAGLVLGSDGALYGTTYNGGADGSGTVFRITKGGSFTVLQNFDFATTGGLLYAGLVSGPSGALYGTASQGGALGEGTVFHIHENGSGFEVLLTFGAVVGGPRELRGGVTYGTDAHLYGTSYSGGSADLGTVFSVNITEVPLGVVARWGFEPTTPVNLVPDLSASGNIGTVVGTPLPTTVGAKVNYSFGLTGANYMTAPSRLSLNFGTEAFAGELWVRWSDSGENLGETPLIEKFTPVPTDSGYWFGLTPGDGIPTPGKLTLKCYDSLLDPAPMEWVTDAAALPSDGVWHLIGFSYDPTQVTAGDRVTFYVDGAPVLSSHPGVLDFIPNVSSPASLRLGASWELPTPATHFIGNMDEVRLFKGTHESVLPVVTGESLTRYDNTVVAKVLKSSLLANDVGPDGATLTITGVGNPTPVGAGVSLVAGFVVYTAPAKLAGDGSFTYTVSDGTHSAVGTVSVLQTSRVQGPGAPNYAKLVPSGADFLLTFLAVPGRSYRVQYTTSLTAPFDWNEFDPAAVVVAPADGIVSYTDVAPVGLGRYYRLIPNP